jgi:ComF family protein
MRDYFSKIIELLFPSSFDTKSLASIPRAPTLGGKNAFALFDYRSRLGRRLIHTIKKHQSRSLAQSLAERVYYDILEQLSEQQSFGYFLNTVIVTIPMTKKQRRKRGFHQCHDIAKYLAEYCQGSYLPQALVKTRETQKQALIPNRSQRFINIRGCFAVPQKYHEILRQRDCIVIDDLCTTGATLSEAQKILTQAGVRNIITITIAH